MTRRSRRCALLALIAVLLAIPTGVGLADNPASGNTSTNQQLTTGVTLDTSGDPVWLGAPVTASATANLGDGDTANIIYVVDVSVSMVTESVNPYNPALDDCDGDGRVGTALDAACLGIIALNQSLGDTDNVNVGLVAYGNGAVTADMSPDAGEQAFTAPATDRNVNSESDVEEVIQSLMTGGTSGSAGVQLFTDKITPGLGSRTDYNAALAQMNAAFASQPEGSTNIAFFMSDGVPTTTLGDPLGQAINAGTIIHTFGVGSGSADACSSNRPLRRIADTTGGTCTEVTVPGDLSTVLPATLTNIESLEILVNGDVAHSVTGAEPVSMSLRDVDISDLPVTGTNTIETRATAADGTSVTATSTLNVLDLTLEPTEATNELTESNSHTVVATVSGDPSQIAGIPVSFEVGGQNAGTAGTCDPADCTTDANGQVSFTYSVPVDAASVGTDTIAATTTINGDQSASREVTKEWVDNSAPVASCTAGANPGGKKPKGRNAAGFYQISAGTSTGAADDLEIYVVDTGSGTEFGPYESGTAIKYTQARGAPPSEKSMGNGRSGGASIHIKGNGEPEVYAVNGFGTESERVSCSG